MGEEESKEAASDVSEAQGQEELTISREEYEGLQYWANRGQRSQNSFWTAALSNPEGTRALIKESINIVLETVMGNWKDMQEAMQKANLRYLGTRLVIVVGLLGVILVVATWLTSLGILESSNFSFLLGILIGYLLTFLTKVELLK
jgi:hypothetical protein